MDNSALETRVKNVEEELRNIRDSKQEMYRRIADLETKTAVSDERYSNIFTTLGKIEAKVEEIAAKPAKRWDGLVGTLITAIVSLTIGAIAMYMGVK